MMRLLADENFDNGIVRGLLSVLPNLDILTVQEAGLAGAKDPELLAWSDQQDRMLLTHDVKTMRGHVAARLSAGLSVTGVVTISDRMPIGRAISELQLFIECSDQHEWKNQLIHLPL